MQGRRKLGECWPRWLYVRVATSLIMAVWVLTLVWQALT